MWRHLPRGSHPFDVRFVLEADGRWNRPGEYGCIYTALTREGAEAEYRKTLRAYELNASDQSERDLVCFGVWIAQVADFTDAATQRRAGVTFVDLTANTSASFELCRSIADAMRADGCAGIISPSAAVEGGRNLTIYIDLTPAANTKLLGIVSRDPFNY